MYIKSLYGFILKKVLKIGKQLRYVYWVITPLVKYAVRINDDFQIYGQSTILQLCQINNGVNINSWGQSNI
jgi:hypothetical protein